MMENLPPIEKIYEAYSAIADERIQISDSNAFVKSSDYSKEYTVSFQDNVYSSNDNGTYWKGYAGYPVIATMMLQGRLSLDNNIAVLFKAINWKELNSKHKGKYDRAVATIIDQLVQQGIDSENIFDEVDKVYSELKALDISVKRNTKRPRKL